MQVLWEHKWYSIHMEEPIFFSCLYFLALDVALLGSTEVVDGIQLANHPECVEAVAGKVGLTQSTTEFWIFSRFRLVVGPSYLYGTNVIVRLPLLLQMHATTLLSSES